jgi:hypothetical protein
MNIKPTAWIKELPTGEGVDRAVRTTTVKEVADDWEQAIPLYTADDLRTAVLAEREACAKLCEKEQFELTQDVSGKNGLQHFDAGCRSCAEMIRVRGEV